MKKLLLLLLFASVCVNVKATNYYWAGTTSTSYSTAANWRTGSFSGPTPGSVPASTDNVYIGNGSSNATIILDNNYTIDSLIVEGSGQIFINTTTSNTLSVTSDIYISNTGTTGGGSATIIISGSGNQTLTNTATSSNKGKLPNVTINKSGGTLFLVGYITMGGSTTLKLTAGTIDPGTSTVSFYLSNTITGVINVYNAEFQGNASTCSITDTLRVNDSLKYSGTNYLILNGNHIKVKGNVIITNSSTTGNVASATIEFIGGIKQKIISTVSEGHAYLPNITISKTGDSLQLSGAISIIGNWTNNYSTSYIAYDRAELYCLGLGTFGGSYSTPVYDLTFATIGGQATYALGKDSAFIIKDSLKINGAPRLILSGHSLLIQGCLINNNPNTVLSSLFIIGGGNNQLIRSSLSENSGFFPPILIQKSAGTVTLKGIISVSGSWTNNYDTTHINCDTSEVFCNNANSTFTIGGTVPCMFYNLTFGGSSNCVYAMSRDTAAIVKHNWTISGIKFITESGHSMLVRGNVVNLNSSTGGGGTTQVILGGSANQTISSTASRGFGYLPSIKLQKSAGTVTLSGVISINGDWINNYISSISYGTAELYFYGTENLGGTFWTPVYRLTLGGSSGACTYTINLDSAFIVKDTFKLQGASFLNLNNHSINAEGPIVMNATTSVVTINTIINVRGGNNQALTGTNNFTLQKLVMNKTGGSFTINKPVTITSSLTLTGGNIISSSTNMVIFNNGATVSGASDNSFVSGPIKKIGNAAFTFPTGKGSYYNPIEITAPSTSTDAFTAEFFNADTLPTSANRDTSLTYDSQCEFWHLYRTTGTDNVKVKLYWNTHTCDIYTTSTLKVAYLNSGTGKWQAIASKALGTTTSGKDSTLSAVTSYGDFTIGKKSPVVSAHAGRDTALCYSASVTIGTSPAATGGLTPYSYSWSPIGGLSSTTGAQPTASPTTTTSYVLTVTDLDHSTSKDTMILTINSNPSAHAGSDTGICYGTSGSIGRIATGGSSPYGYSWSPSTGLNSSTISEPIANPTITTSYVVTVTDHNTCKAKDTINVTVNPLPTAHAGNDTTICYGLSTIIGRTPAATGGSSPYTYQWFPSISLSSSSIMQPIATPRGLTNNYTLIVTDANRCKAQQQMKVTVTPFNFCFPCGL